MKSLLLPLFSIALAELGDKTQLSILLLSTRTKKHFELLLGVMLAFFIVDGAAILLFSWIAKMLPVSTVRIFAGIVFIIFGLFMLRNVSKEQEQVPELKNPFLAGFSLVFISELGDKTQIASGLFAASLNPWMVLAGAMIALGTLSVLAVYLGKLIGDRINQQIMSKVAGTVFILMGLTFLIFRI